MLNQIIKEDLLYYLWKTKSFLHKDLKTTDGKPIHIIDYGFQNHDAGPDFSNARIKIGDTEWAGNVEMHVFSKDWDRHSHDVDSAYDNVILHVVYEHDKDIYTTTEHLIPTLEMKDLIPSEIRKNYAQLITNDNWIPCEKSIHSVPEHKISFWQQRLVAERLEEKTKYLKTIFEATNQNWEETTYIFLARYMGARVNMEPFESLAINLPLNILLKHKDDLMQIEALLFGTAGMLQADFTDAYFQELKQEFEFLSMKYDIHPISIISWKFARMRPAGFPTIRISQLAQIVQQTQHLFSFFTNATSVKEIKSALAVVPSFYWESHYKFGTISTIREKKIGDGFLDLIIINVVAPLLFLYGKSIAEETYCEKAIDFLEALKPEKNKIITGYKSLGVPCKSAADSQALIQLNKKYCAEKRCLSCAIGKVIIDNAKV